jgi:hypothetical protein
MEPGLNERLVPAADQRRFASAARRRRLLQSCLWLACLAVALVPANGRTEPIDTEHLFAFTIGSDVGEVGEKEVEGSVTGRFAKQSGTYVAGTSTLSVEYVPIPNLRTELTGVVNAYDITGVSGLLDQRYTAFGGLGADIRYRLLDRATAPFGLAIGAEARYLRLYDGSGFDNLAGEGFFAGPTIYFKLSERAWLAAGWSAQVAGHATASIGSLDLVNFERHQARVLFGVNF